MYYYLLGVLESKTFERDPVMLVFVASFIVTISCLQLCIEVKKYNTSRLEKQQIKAAVEASRSLEDAILKVQNVCAINMIPTVSIIDLGKDAQSVVPPKAYRKKILQQITAKKRNNNKLKVARGICIFAILPTGLFAILFYLENIQELRPLATIAFGMIFFGIFAPLMLILQNKNLKQFSKKLIFNRLQDLKWKKRRNHISPI